MNHADVALALILLGLSAYLLFGGADFGAGAWHLIRKKDDREVIEHAMAPVWEANHVWLIFVMVMAWTAFPPIFADVMGSHWVPLSLAVLGIVIRGSAFVFYKTVPHGAYGWAFGLSSVLTPFCFGAVAGAVATDEAWLSALGVYAGVLTTGLCAYLAAVYLTWDAHRTGNASVERFRSRALAAGAVVGVLAVPGAVKLGVESPLLGLSVLAGLASLALLVRRRYVAVRVTAALAVGSVLWGAASMSSLDLDGTVASDASLQVVYIALGVGAVFLVPSLTWLYILFQRSEPTTASVTNRGGLVESAGGQADRADHGMPADERGAGDGIEGGSVGAEGAEQGYGDGGAGSHGAVGDLDYAGAAVGEAEGVHALGSAFEDEAGYGGHESGFVSAGT